MIDPDELTTGRSWAQASLRIASDRLSADAIGELLGRRPTTARESEGEPTFTVWVLESGLEPTAPPEDHLYILMEGLKGAREALAELARNANCEVWLSFSPEHGSHRPAILDAGVLGELGELGIDLVLEPYPPDRTKPR